MRALCGAIITAGALIGLGLTSLGYGLRYGGPAFGPATINPNTNMLWGSSSLMVILIILLIALMIGLGTAFLGLAFHHYRRYQEHLREMGRDRESRVST
jgi:ABC-type Na+ efflux pump permease subunit